jgi:hypothetical protein
MACAIRSKSQTIVAVRDFRWRRCDRQMTPIAGLEELRIQSLLVYAPRLNRDAFNIFKTRTTLRSPRFYFNVDRSLTRRAYSRPGYWTAWERRTQQSTTIPSAEGPRAHEQLIRSSAELVMDLIWRFRNYGQDYVHHIPVRGSDT